MVSLVLIWLLKNRSLALLVYHHNVELCLKCLCPIQLCVLDCTSWNKIPLLNPSWLWPAKPVIKNRNSFCAACMYSILRPLKKTCLYKEDHKSKVTQMHYLITFCNKGYKTTYGYLASVFIIVLLREPTKNSNHMTLASSKR